MAQTALELSKAAETPTVPSNNASVRVPKRLARFPSHHFEVAEQAEEKLSERAAIFTPGRALCSGKLTAL